MTTPAQREQARNAILGFHRRRHEHPRCGARRKSDGEPCQDLAMANGRCFRHGGRTGAGKNWHRPVWPPRDSPAWERKFNRKLADLERARLKRERRVSEMSEPERAAYDAWQAAHEPGEAGPRARRRNERQQAADFRQRLAADMVTAPNPELAKIEAEIAALKLELATAQKTDEKRT